MKKAQAIIEVLIAVAVTSIALLAVSAMAKRSVSSSGFSTRQTEASNFAQQAIDWIRSRKEVDGWDTLYAKGGACNGCWPAFCFGSVPSDLNHLYSGCSSDGSYIPGTNYKRRVLIENDIVYPPAAGVQQVSVKAEVSWIEASGNTPRGVSVQQSAIFSRY